MEESKIKLEQIFKNMLEGTIQEIDEDEFYQKDVKTFPLKVNWKMDDLKAYQIYEADNYSYKFGEELENPDLAFTIKNIELGKKFLEGELEGFKYAPRSDYKGRFKIQNVVGWKDREGGNGETPIVVHWLTVKFDKNRKYHPLMLMKLPIFKKLVREEIANTSKNFGAYLPINKSLDFENQVLPLKVIKHFIDKAANIVVRTKCGCRDVNNCQNYDHSIGCMYMGRDTLSMKSAEGLLELRELNKEEAWDHVNRAYKEGLIPLLGRSMGEAAIFGVEETGHFMSMCFCCECCCFNAKLMTHGPSEVSSILFPRMKGLEIKDDLDKCIGCGKCVEACAFGARKLVDEKTLIDQERCLGCGRCETACPTGAITLEFNDAKCLEEHIKTLESYVDVS